MASILNQSTSGHLYESLTGWGPLSVPCGRLMEGLTGLSSILNIPKAIIIPEVYTREKQWTVLGPFCSW